MGVGLGLECDMVLEVTGEWSSGVGAANELANATPSPSSPATAARCVLNCRVYVPRGGRGRFLS